MRFRPDRDPLSRLTRAMEPVSDDAFSPVWQSSAPLYSAAAENAGLLGFIDKRSYPRHPEHMNEQSIAAVRKGTGTVYAQTLRREDEIATFFDIRRVLAISAMRG